MSTKVGTAYVVVRALTNKLGKDIKDAVERDPNIAAAGDRIGETIGESVKEHTRDAVREGATEGGEEGGTPAARGFVARFVAALRGFRQKIIDALTPDGGSGRRSGKSLAVAFASGFLEAASKIPTMLLAIPPIISLIGAAAKIAAAYLGSLVSLSAPLVPALAASAAGFATLITLGGQLLGTFKLLTLETETLARFKDTMQPLKEVWFGIAEAIQKELLPTVAIAAYDLTAAFGPMLQKRLVGTAKIMGSLVTRFVDLAKTPLFKNRFDAILKGNNGILKELTNAILPLAESFFILARAAQPMIKIFATWIATTAQGWADTLRIAEANGRLAAWFKKQVDFLKQLGRIFRNLGIVVKSLFRAAGDSGKTFWDSFEKGTEKWAKWTSGEGQDRLKRFFDNAVPVVQEFNKLIGDVLKAIFGPTTQDPTSLVKGIESFRLNVLPAITDIAKAFAGSGPAFVRLLESVADVIKTMADSGALGAVVGGITAVVDAIGWLLKLPGAGTVAAWGLALLGLGKGLSLFGLKGPIIKGLQALTGGAGGAGLLARIGPAIAGAFTAMSGPVGIIVGVIAAVVAGFVLMYTKVEWFREMVDGAVQEIVDAFSELWEMIEKDLIPVIQDLWETIEPAVKFIAGIVANQLVLSFKILFGIIKVGVMFAIINIKAFVEAIKAIVQRTKETWENIKKTWNTMVDFIRDLPSKISTAASGMWDGIKNAFRSAINWIINAWNQLSFTFPSIDFDWNGPLPGGETTVGGWTINTPNLPTFAKGGVVRPSTGGSVVRVAEAGMSERIEPLDSEGLSKRDREILKTLGGTAGAEVRVFIGERELTDIVRVEVHEVNAATSKQLFSGRRT